MSPRFLSVDLGNSRCKLRLWSVNRRSPPELLATADLDSDAQLGVRARAWLAVQPAAHAAGLSSVADAALEDDLVRALAAHGIGSIDRRPDPGLEVECREPERVGRDRLFAARGALELVQGSAIVVDAGTALTVDALRAGQPPRRASFLGGAIAPGPQLSAAALARGTARLPRIEPTPGVRALGQDTASALQAGVVVGFEGAARELVLRVASEAALLKAPVVLTGGARGFLTASASFGRGLRLVEEPELVALGLLAACASELWASPGGV